MHICTITHAIGTRPYFNRPGLETRSIIMQAVHSLEGPHSCLIKIFDIVNLVFIANM